MKKTEYDFGGWATKNNLLCSDGRTIVSGAFSKNNGKSVPLVWQHSHDDPSNVIGHVDLEEREDGIYAYGKLNDTERGQDTKKLIRHGDIVAMSIYANQIKMDGNKVVHGDIKEVSLVLAGANPGAYIDWVNDVEHSYEGLNKAYIYTGFSLDNEIKHTDSDDQNKSDNGEYSDRLDNTVGEDSDKAGDDEGKTVGDVFKTLNEDQKIAVAYAISEMTKENKKDEKDDKNIEQSDLGGDNTMQRNVFDQDNNNNKEDLTVLSHDDFMKIVDDARENKMTLKNSFIKHGYDPDTIQHGVKELGLLFPEAKNPNAQPEWLKRDTAWVQRVLGGSSKTPFAKVKSIYANITKDEARARGYLTGDKKVGETFELLGRETHPQTVYKTQQMDRDDIIDISDFNVVTWLKTEMQEMLNEEVARAALVSDGRDVMDPAKIKEDRIRPIYGDNEFYTIYKTVKVGSTPMETATNMIDASLKARVDYKGSGNPSLFVAPSVLSELLIVKDKDGKYLFQSLEELKARMRVSDIIEAPVLEGVKKDSKYLYGLILNIKDYNFGSNQGGKVSMFDDFDIDFNQEKYLIETRVSGALVKPYSAIALEGESKFLGSDYEVPVYPDHKTLSATSTKSDIRKKFSEPTEEEEEEESLE